MKKLSIELVRNRLDTAITRLEGRLDRATGLSLTEQRLLAESSLLTSAVLWEAFIHDIFVVYINHDSSQLKRSFEQRLEQSAKEKFGAFVAGHIKLHWPEHINKEQVLAVLDRDGKNISFASAEDMVERAGQWLARSKAERFRSLTGAELATLNLSKAVRNYLAHRSPSGKQALDDALVEACLCAKLRRGSNTKPNVGAHFAAVEPAHGSSRRIDVMLGLLKSIGAKL